MNPASHVRPAAVSGMFYPSQEHALRLQIHAYIDTAGESALGGTLHALIVPHAGYVYSGLTAAHAYTALRYAAPDIVVVLAPSHREWFSGFSVYDGSAYRTPLGTVAVAEEIRAQLLEADGPLSASASGHRAEHAVEVQLPFLQVVLNTFTFLPIVMGEYTTATLEWLAAALSNSLAGKSAVVIASSDLSHYHTLAEAVDLDRIAAHDIAELDDARFLEHIEQGDAEACGAGPIITAIRYARRAGADSSRILYQCTSADSNGDTSHVVGYLSAALWKKN